MFGMKSSGRLPSEWSWDEMPCGTELGGCVGVSARCVRADDRKEYGRIVRPYWLKSVGKYE